VSARSEFAIQYLSAADQRCVEDHQRFGWLQFLFFASGNSSGFLVYKTTTFKRLPSADVLYISDKTLFAQCWPALRTHLALRGIVTSRVERRLMDKVPGFSFDTTPASAKFYLSDTLSADAFDYTYSELVAMDL
jgi:hypothetical protein